jgi:hypothetical protein
MRAGKSVVVVLAVVLAGCGADTPAAFALCGPRLMLARNADGAMHCEGWRGGAWVRESVLNRGRFAVGGA